MDWTKKVVLFTGGAGSFGEKSFGIMLDEYRPPKNIAPIEAHCQAGK